MTAITWMREQSIPKQIPVLGLFLFQNEQELISNSRADRLARRRSSAGPYSFEHIWAIVNCNWAIVFSGMRFADVILDMLHIFELISAPPWSHCDSASWSFQCIAYIMWIIFADSLGSRCVLQVVSSTAATTATAFFWKVWMCYITSVFVI